jgi:hypothetical protein
MNEDIEKRFQAIDEQLKELRKEMKDWEQYKKDHCSKFDVLVKELKETNPDEWEEAEIWVKDLEDIQ